MNKILRMRAYWTQQGDHVQMRLFAGMVPDDGKEYTLACCGALIMRVDEFYKFRVVCPAIEFIGPGTLSPSAEAMQV